MTLTPENKQKLLEIAKSLDTQPVEQFNMQHLSGGCGTSFCAIGWYTLSKIHTKINFMDVDATYIFHEDCNDVLYSLGWPIDENIVKLFGNKSKVKSPKLLARVIRRFVRTGVLEFKKSEVRE